MLKRLDSLPQRALTWTETLDARYKQAAPSLFITAFASVGVIYGDIGTSPLYVLNGIFPPEGPAPSAEDTIGAISAVLWALTIVPLIKYSLIALENRTGEGEGGPFALFSQMYPPQKPGTELNLPSIASIDHLPSGATPFLSRRFVKPIMRVITLFAVALIISDGILTPAVSVSSAVSGIAIPAPSFSSKSIEVVSIAILVLIFLSQSYGTNKLGMSFAPIVTVWLLLLSGIGIYNITKHPGVFRAFDPSRAILYFVRVKDLTPLSGVLLSITGVEALFANLGQFSKGAIRLSFIAWIYPALILAYLGQGAQLITNGEHVITNIFYQSIPGGSSGALWWIVWIFGMLATIVASQAMITASFSLIQQMVGLKAFPPVAIIHTSKTSPGQIYAPSVNFILLIGTVGVTAGFGSNSSLTSAYGFAVAGVLFATTFLMTMVMFDNSHQIHVKGVNLWVGVLFFVVTGFVDAAFFASTLKKVPHGAWFTLTLGCLIGIFLLFWTWAKELEDLFDSNHRVRLSQLLIHRLPHMPSNLSKENYLLGSKDNEPSIDEEIFKELDAVDHPESQIGCNKFKARLAILRNNSLPPISDLALHEEPEEIEEFDEKHYDSPDQDLRTQPGSILTTSRRYDSPAPEIETPSSPTQQALLDTPKRSSSRDPSPGGTQKITIAEPAERKASSNTTNYPPIQSNQGPNPSSPQNLTGSYSSIPRVQRRQASQLSTILGSELGGSEHLTLNPAFYEGRSLGDPLPRLECFSFFHHHGRGIGAPHSFTSLLKHQPALPRVIVFLSIRVVGVPHLQEEDKYLIDKLRSLEALRLGYKDDLDLRDLTTPTLQRIVAMERGTNVAGQNPSIESRIAQFVKASENSNHIIPHYHCTSKKIDAAKNPFKRIRNAMRSFLLEEVYRRVSQNFPESSNYIIDDSKVLRIGVNAEI
ncbi:potassium transporter-domain-containing protein [Melampsora americana]|nr:potassium transporter-domain-containing protein [Melampsora americana]